VALSGFHLRVAQVLAAATSAEGFALGGGYGLQAHEIVDRPSEDLDAFVASMDPEVFVRAESELVSALEAAGLRAEVQGRDDWFRGINVSSPQGEEVQIDLNYRYRTKPPIIIANIGPVLDTDDLILGKMTALMDREAERDFIDTDAILQDGRWSPTDLFASVKQVRPALSQADFEQTLRRAHEGNPAVYADLGFALEDQQALFARLESAANGGEVYVSAHVRHGHPVAAHWRGKPGP
jgi:hypothetical protein